MFLMSEGEQNVYEYFIFSFLSRQNVSGTSVHSSIYVFIHQSTTQSICKDMLSTCFQVAALLRTAATGLL